MPRPLTTDEQRLIDAVRDALLAKRSTSITDDTIREISRLVATVTTRQLDCEPEVGTLCTTSDLEGWLGISRQAIHKAVREGRLIAIRPTGRSLFYPTWQLTSQRTIHPGVAPVLRRLRDHLDDMAIARWFVTPLEELDGLSPAYAVVHESDLHHLIGCAEREARRHRR